MDFTTITKPMIEENTISLAASRSTPLDSLGLKPEEQMRLERLGVTNLAQLDRLKGSTGVSTVARLAEMPVDRLRRALRTGLPKIGGVIGGVTGGVAPPRPAPPPATAPVPAPTPGPRPPVFTPPAPRPPKPVGGRPLLPPPEPRPPVRPVPASPLKPGGPPIGSRKVLYQPQDSDAESFADDPEEPVAEVLEVDPASSRLTLGGRHLLHEDYPPEVRLNGDALEIEELDDNRLVVLLPQGFAPGALEVRLGDQPVTCFALVHPLDGGEPGEQDPWAPAEGGPRHEA